MRPASKITRWPPKRSWTLGVLTVMLALPVGIYVSKKLRATGIGCEPPVEIAHEKSLFQAPPRRQLTSVDRVESVRISANMISQGDDGVDSGAPREDQPTTSAAFQRKATLEDTFRFGDEYRDARVMGRILIYPRAFSERREKYLLDGIPHLVQLDNSLLVKYRRNSLNGEKSPGPSVADKYDFDWFNDIPPQISGLTYRGKSASGWHEYERAIVGARPIVLVLVPGGTYMMGAPPPAGLYIGDAVQGRVKTGQRADVLQGSNGRRRPVTLEPFLIGKYEITQDQWKAVMSGRFPHHVEIALEGILRAETELYQSADHRERATDVFGLGDDYPIYGTTPREVAVFCKRLGAALPTEAQWELAARAATDAPTYNWEPRFDTKGWNSLERLATPLHEIAWFLENSEVSYKSALPFIGRTKVMEPGEHRHGSEFCWYCSEKIAIEKGYSVLTDYRNHACLGAHPTGTRKPNAWGLYDMLGNVAELCADSQFQLDKYDNDLLSLARNPTNNPELLDAGTYESIIRGGSWASMGYLSTVFFRGVLDHRCFTTESGSCDEGLSRGNLGVVGFRVAYPLAGIVKCPDEDWPIKLYCDIRDPDSGEIVSVPEMFRPEARPAEAPIRTLEEALALRSQEALASDD